MSDLNFDDKSKEELEAIAAKEAEEARIAQEKADAEAAEAAAAKKAAEEALARKVAAEAGAPVNSPSNKSADEKWRFYARKMGFNRNKKRPAGWGE